LVQSTYKAEQQLLPARLYPLAEIQRLCGRQLFETAFYFVHFHVYESLAGLGGLQLLDGHFYEETNFTLMATFHLDPRSSQLWLGLIYDHHELDQAAAQAIAGYYQSALQAIARDPFAGYLDLPLLSGEERRRQLVEWNETEVDYG